MSKSCGFTMAQARACLYPFPVYVASLSDGTTARMSFWSPKGKPVDILRGRRVVANIRRCQEQFVITSKRKFRSFLDRSSPLKYQKSVKPGLDIVSGAVEWQGKIVATDDLTPEPVKPKRRPSAKVVGQVLIDFLAYMDGANDDPAVIQRAREMAQLAA